MGRSIVVAVVALVAACWTAGAAAAPAADAKGRAPTLAVRPRSARAGGKVVLYGRGFRPLARVVLLAGTRNGEPVRIGRAKSDADGELVAPVAIRRDVRPGRYVAYACRHRCRVQASAAFRVLAPR